MKLLLCINAILISFFSISQDVDRSKNKLLWEVTGNGLDNPSYLYGSFHNNSKAVFQFPDSTLWAIDQADAVVLETSITEMMNTVDVREKKQWWDFYTTKDNNRKKEVNEDYTKTSYGDDEGNEQFIDMYFQQIADNCDKKFFPLEKISDQMKLSALPRVLKEGVNLKVLSREVENFDIQDAYLRGDIDELYSFTKKTSEIYEGYFEALLPNRNLIMANGLDTLMHQNKVFCAVGAAHLSGEKGIIQLLRNKGYKLRPVVPVYSKKLETYFHKFKKCNGYMYRDELYGFKVRLNGKPKVTDEDGARKFTYQEMGQGNSYHMQVRYLEKQTNWNDFAQSFFVSKYGDTAVYNTIKLPDGTSAYEGVINKNTHDALWIRSFTKNDISYLMYCSGGSKFMNSNRPQDYFNKFEFLPSDLYEIVYFDTIITPTNTLEIVLPQGGITSEEKGERLKWWKHVSFNPATGESYFIYETILVNNRIYVHSDNYGEYLLDEYSEDSIVYYDSIISDDYLQKKFKATLNGKESYGTIKREGNILQFVQYKGNSVTNRDRFLNSFTRKPFKGPGELFSIRRSAFSTKVPSGGFKSEQNNFNREYLTYKHYILNDYENATLYEVQHTKLKPWAFVEDSLKQVLRNEIRWPAKNYESIVDTTFSMHDSIPTMSYSIHYKESQNLMRGKSFINGKEIITYKVTFPISMKKKYEQLYFLDSISLVYSSNTTLHDYSIQELQKQLDGNIDEQYAILDFFYYNNFQPETAKKLLYELTNLDITGDRDRPFRSSPRYYLAYMLDSAQVDDRLYNYWKINAKNGNPGFNKEMLEKFANHGTNDFYMHNAVKFINSNQIRLNSTYDFMNYLDKYPERFKAIWLDIQLLLKQDLNPPSSMYADLVLLANDPFYNSFIRSKEFRKFSLDKKKRPWVKTRYFETLFAANESEEIIAKNIKKWKIGSSEFDQGGRIAIEHKLHGNLSEKQFDQLDNIVCAMRYCEVMNRMGDTKLYKEKFSYLKMLGYIGFEYYLDNKDYAGYTNVEFQNMVVFTDHVGTERSYAHYAVFKQGRKYRFVIELPKNEHLPNRKELDKSFNLLGEYDEYPLKELTRDLKEYLEAKDDRK